MHRARQDFPEILLNVKGKEYYQIQPYICFTSYIRFKSNVSSLIIKVHFLSCKIFISHKYHIKNHDETLSHVWYFLSTVMFSRLYCASNSYYSYLSATCFRFLVAPRGSGKNRAIKASASRRPDLKGAIFGRVGGRACARGGETERRRLNDRNERSKHTEWTFLFYRRWLLARGSCKRANKSSSKMFRLNTFAFTTVDRPYFVTHFFACKYRDTVLTFATARVIKSEM